VSEPFDGRHVRNRPSFHGRVSTNRSDRGFQNYLNLITDGYKICVFLNGSSTIGRWLPSGRGHHRDLQRLSGRYP
jgi:hypothetical protein